MWGLEKHATLNPIPLLRAAGLSVVFRKALEQTWWTKMFLGLRCDLGSLPPICRAKFDITMRPCNSATFSGFTEELQQAKGFDYIDVFLRKSLCDGGVQTLHIAVGPDGSPAYAQWLVTARDQHLLHSHQPGRYPTLAPDEVLLEGAYTFCRFRRTGVMADGMAQLLRIAKEGGARVAFTYVGADNIPSLRGCANVGFVPDHLRLNIRRLGRRSSLVQPPGEHALQSWKAATSPRSST